MRSPLFKIVMTFYGIIGSTLASVLVVVALVNGVSGLWPLLGAVGVGFVVGLPVSYFVAKAMIGD
ncbi:CTP synthetase [uncultured Aliiroseovarius sp.]|uniref:CTP synthetase n=1 Tax=uncultured Aliiroseovarius sp. TaxID=1658783 RepID=UPI00259AB21C|nr:CTP synthetase [uncultured Aliiroseovarius sp.]